MTTKEGVAVGNGSSEGPTTERYTEEKQANHDTGFTPVNASLHSQSVPTDGSIETVSFCANPAGDYADGTNSLQKIRRSRSNEPAPSLGTILREAAIRHQFGIAVNILLLGAFSWLLFPSLRSRLEVFGTLRYPISIGAHGSKATSYGQGPEDIGIVVAFIVLMTAIRAATLDCLLLPLAAIGGVKAGKPRVRFAEQAYLLLYYIVYWTWGVWIFVADTPASLPTSAEGNPQPLTATTLLISLWTHYPRLTLSASMKLYYLSQLAFWTQQIIVIHLEARRKDHYQMLTHHFVTVALVAGSYGYRQTRVGNAILVCMDVIDLIFPTAKIFKYLGWQQACDLTFALFVMTWLVCRHGCYLAICWSIYAHVHNVVMPYGLYSLSSADTTDSRTGSGYQISTDGGNAIWSNIAQPFVNPTATTVSFNANIKWAFLSLLLGLQFITFLWFLMICRIVARVLRGDGADDSRSDDEEEGEDVEEGDIKTAPVQPSVPFTTKPALAQQKYIEVEASSADLAPMSVKRGASSGSSSSKRKAKGLSTGLNLGDHKEILNRIGCLSEEQLAREREKRSPDPSRPSSARR